MPIDASKNPELWLAFLPPDTNLDKQTLASLISNPSFALKAHTLGKFPSTHSSEYKLPNGICAIALANYQDNCVVTLDMQIKSKRRGLETDRQVVVNNVLCITADPLTAQNPVIKVTLNCKTNIAQEGSSSTSTMLSEQFVFIFKFDSAY